MPVFLHSLMVEEWKMNGNIAKVKFLSSFWVHAATFRIYHILGYDGRVLLGRRSHRSFMKSMIRLSGMHLHTTKEREIEAKK